MTPILFLECFAMGIMGAIIFILIQINKLQVRSKAANVPFSLSQYFKDDWAAIALSFATVLVSILGVDELTKYKPEILDYIKWFFLLIGYCGGSVLTALLSRANKKLLDIVDVKTNIADNVNQPTNEQ